MKKKEIYYNYRDKYNQEIECGPKFFGTLNAQHYGDPCREGGVERFGQRVELEPTEWWLSIRFDTEAEAKAAAEKVLR